MTKELLKIKLDNLKNFISGFRTEFVDIPYLKPIYKKDEWVCIDAISDFARTYDFETSFDVEVFEKAIDEYFDYMVEAQELV